MPKSQTSQPLSRRTFLTLAVAAIAHGCGEAEQRPQAKRRAPALRVRSTQVSDGDLVSIGFAADGRSVFAGDGSGVVRRLEIVGGGSDAVHEGSGRVWGLEVNRKGDVAWCEQGGDVLLVRRGAGKPERLARGEGAFSIAWEPNGDRLAVGRGDGSVELIGDRVLRGLDTEVLGLAWSPDGKRIAGVTFAGDGRVWTLSGAREAAELVYPDDDYGADMNGVRWIDERRLVVASQDGTLRVWNADDGSIEARLERDGGWARALAVRSDGKLLGDAGADGIVRTTSLPDRAPVDAGRLGDVAVWALAFSPDGRRLAAACSDGAARLIDIAAAPG